VQLGLSKDETLSIALMSFVHVIIVTFRLLIFVQKEQKFRIIFAHGSENCKERKLLRRKVPGSESSQERKYVGMKVPVTVGSLRNREQRNRECQNYPTTLIHNLTLTLALSLTLSLALFLTLIPNPKAKPSLQL